MGGTTNRGNRGEGDTNGRRKPRQRKRKSLVTAGKNWTMLTVSQGRATTGGLSILLTCRSSVNHFHTFPIPFPIPFLSSGGAGPGGRNERRNGGKGERKASGTSGKISPVVVASLMSYSHLLTYAPQAGAAKRRYAIRTRRRNVR